MPLRKLLFVLGLAVATWALCPLDCTCYLDNRGRKGVLCDKGGMQGPISLTNMSSDIEIIKITAPEDNTNMLTMSPVFSNYKRLEEIRITRSNIPQLGTYFFYGLSKLDVLDLSQNNITQPLENNFRGLSKLKELYLDDNRITSLPSGTFRYLQELKVLSIQRNRLSELVPRLFFEIKKLRVLKLSGNYLKELNSVAFEDVQDLRTLECRSCGLTKIDRRISELLPHLAHLDLGDNQLTSLTTDELKPLTSLRQFKLDGNRITLLKSAVFFNQNELKRLHLARNDLRQISADAFANLHNLTELDVAYNKLEQQYENWLEPVADTLEILVLSGNHMTMQHLKNMLTNLTALTELYLDDCGLVNIPYQLFPENLEVLSLSANHFSTISGEVVPGSLREIDLSRNRFRGFEEDLLDRLESVQNFKLAGNPFSCDLCYIIPLLKRANRSETIRNSICAQPFTAKGKNLGELKRNELTWCTVPSYTSSDANYFLLGDDGKIGLIAASTSVFLLLITAVSVLAVLCYSRRHAAKYYTHEDKLAMDGESVFDNHSPLFGEDRELSFKFPLGERKVSVATIDEVKKEHAITNGT